MKVLNCIPTLLFLIILLVRRNVKFRMTLSEMARCLEEIGMVDE